jgi:hypothetical protein
MNIKSYTRHGTDGTDGTVRPASHRLAPSTLEGQEQLAITVPTRLLVLEAAVGITICAAARSAHRPDRSR